jgi:hypothetical protein
VLVLVCVLIDYFFTHEHSTPSDRCIDAEALFRCFAQHHCGVGANGLVQLYAPYEGSRTVGSTRERKQVPAALDPLRRANRPAVPSKKGKGGRERGWCQVCRWSIAGRRAVLPRLRVALHLRNKKRRGVGGRVAELASQMNCAGDFASQLLVSRYRCRVRCPRLPADEGACCTVPRSWLRVPW